MSGIRPTGARRSGTVRAGFAVVVVASTLCFLLRAPLLAAVALGLVVDEPLANCRCLLVLGGDQCYLTAADSVHAGRVDHVLLLEDRTTRLVAYGIVPRWDEILRHELTRAGVPHSSIRLLDGQARDLWEAVERLSQWLHHNPDSHLAVTVDRFQSRQLRYVLDELLDPEDAARVHVHAQRDRRFYEGNWWKSRTGIKACFYGYLSLIYNFANGQPEDRYRDQWNPDLYAQQLQSRAALSLPAGPD